MSRRSGQAGNVFQPHANSTRWVADSPAYGRIWVDTPTGRVRRTVPLGKLPTRTIARQKLREYIEQQGINTPEQFEKSTNPASTFKYQSTLWVESLSTRRRKPVKPATIAGWSHCLDRWLNPNLGDMPLSDISNGAVKTLVEKMSDAGMSAKTILNNVAVVKMVLASSVNENGEALFPRVWNHEFIGLPVVDKASQVRQTVTQAELEHILKTISERFRPLVALIAATGLRIGEALGVKHSDFSNDCTLLHIQRSVWGGVPQSPKTTNAVRLIDIPEMFAKVLREYVNESDAYLFATKAKTPMNDRNALKALHAVKVVGFHAFRRYRTETLRRQRVPEDLIRMWLGHASSSVTDLYAEGLRNDEQFRRQWCESVGVGFSLVGLRGYTNLVEIKVAKGA